MPTPSSRSTRSGFVRLGIVVAALVLAACQAQAAPSSSVRPVAIGSAGPSAPPPSLGVPSTSPSPSPSTAPTPAPTWSKPVTVAGLSGCTSIVLAVDTAGTKHLAATCGSESSSLRYSVSTDGKAWTTTPLDPPADRQELDPQLAFSGNTLYLAYTRVVPADGGCGDDGIDDVGVWYRTRALPDGGWSEPTRIGTTADHLEAFRVHGGVVHATVTNEQRTSSAYLVVDGGSADRYELPGALGSSSLRVGDDGKGRIAYVTAKGIGYGMVENGRFVAETVAGDVNAHGPLLTLAPGNAAYLLWSETYQGAGCAEPDPLPTFGTYIATNESGSWVSSRLTTLLGSSSLTIDQTTGDLHVLVTDSGQMVHFQRPAAGGDWTRKTIARDLPSSAMIRQDPTNGALVVAYTADVNDTTPFDVRVMFRR